MRHVVERRVEALVLGSKLQFLDLQDLVAPLQFRVGVAQGLVDLLELGGGGLQILRQDSQLPVRPAQETVVPAEKSDQQEAADDQAASETGEEPMEADEFIAILSGPQAAVMIRFRGEPGQSRFEGIENGEGLLYRAGGVEIVEEGLGLGERIVELLDRLAPLRIPLHEILELSFTEKLRPAREDVEAQLDFVLIDTAPPAAHRR